MAYQANQPDIYRCLSLYVDKILTGAKPGGCGDPVSASDRPALAARVGNAVCAGLPQRSDDDRKTTRPIAQTMLVLAVIAGCVGTRTTESTG